MPTIGLVDGAKIGVPFLGCELIQFELSIFLSLSKFRIAIHEIDTDKNTH